MKAYLDKLNLRPQERRLLVAVVLVIFVLVNMWFVWPRFGDWSEYNGRMDRNRQTLATYQSEIARKQTYENRLKELQETGSQMLDNDLEMQRIVRNTASASGISVSDLSPRPFAIGASTNRFFQEQILSMTFSSGEKELVDFLVNLASENVMIRVRELNVKPDQSQTRLTGNMMLVANYQRKQTPAAPDKPMAKPARKS